MPSTLHSTFHLARFELLRIARVPTVMGYFLGPLLLYPALIWGELQVFSLMEGERATEVYRIAVDDPELAELLADVERLDIRDPSEATADALDRSTIDAYVTRGDEGPVVHHATWSLKGAGGAGYVAGELEDGIEKRAREAYLAAGGTKGVWSGHRVKVVQPKGGDEQLFEKLLAVLVGLMTPLSVLVTASQPACAVFLSDREEGTAETLLTTRVPRAALAAGKVLAVIALLVLSAIANALLLWAACMQALTVLAEDVVFIAPDVVGAGIGLMGLTTYCILLSLLLTTLIVPLRTYKEGQSMASVSTLPVMGPLLVGALALIWDEPAPWMWWTPFVHTPMLLDAALRSTWTPLHLVQCLGVDLAAAGAWAALLSRFPGPVGLVVGAWRPRWVDTLLGSDT